MQGKGPTKKGVRDDLCDKMMSMVNDKETYMGKKNNRGKTSCLQHQLRTCVGPYITFGSFRTG